MEFDDVIAKRASIRRYSNKKFSIELVMEAINSAHLAPSPGNLPILRYIIVQEKEKIAKIAKACQQPFIADAPFVVVVCSDSQKAVVMYGERGEKYAAQHSGAAIENFLLKIADIGLASCWIGAFSDETIRNLLSIPDNVKIEAVLPVAYAIAGDSTKQRSKPTLDKRIWFNVWKNKFEIPYRKVRRDDL